MALRVSTRPHPLFIGSQFQGDRPEARRPFLLEPDPKGSAIRVIAEGRSLDGKERFPVAWTVERSKGRTVCITLGHDGRAHENASYRTLLANASRWLLAR